VRQEAALLTTRAGELGRKIAMLEKIAAEDSARVARLLATFAASSVTRREEFTPLLVKARADFVRINRRLRKKHGRKSSRAEFEKDGKWSATRNTVERLAEHVEAENAVLAFTGDAFARMRAWTSIAVLVDTSVPAVARARRAPEVRKGILEALWKQSVERVADHVLVFASDANLPEARARVHCVPSLVRVRRKATGLMAEEIDIALYTFTGRKFFGAGANAMWEGWWRNEGAAWLEAVRAERHRIAHPERKGSAAFYGIATRSNRIVFVLDRSGSMKDPVPQRGTVTGSSRNAPVPGKTKLEVAKNQLARTIRGLQPDVKFAVVFYSHEVRGWEDPPKLLPATAQNKRKAIEWFMRLEPVGSTMFFDALREALRYANVGSGKSKTDPRGADTIFILSDGAPSTKGGAALLPPRRIETELQAFLDANRAFRCVVHTIGVGKEHNIGLMQRLARETGGTYRAVGR